MLAVEQGLSPVGSSILLPKQFDLQLLGARRSLAAVVMCESDDVKTAQGLRAGIAHFAQASIKLLHTASQSDVCWALAPRLGSLNSFCQSLWTLMHLFLSSDAGAL